MAARQPKPEELNTKALNRLPSDKPIPERGPRPDQVQPPWRLLLQIEADIRQTVGLQVTEEMTIGRADDTQEPDFDLTPYGALANGVSRVHAAFSLIDDTIFIEDRSSTNGTRINGFQLPPQQKYRLRDGDEVEFGRLRATVRFIRSS